MTEYFKLNELSIFSTMAIRTLIRITPPRVSEEIYYFSDLLNVLSSYPNVNLNERYSGGNVCNHITFFGSYKSYGDNIFINRNQFNFKNMIVKIK